MNLRINKEIETDRIDWIDICKFISICIVAYLHFGAPKLVNEIFHIFHIPIFFVLSGICINDKKNNTRGFIKSRARKLLFPYLMFGIIIYLFWTIFHLILIPDRVVSFELFFSHFLFINTDTINFVWGSIQWFLTCLFFTEVAWFILYKVLRKDLFVVIVTALVSFFTIPILQKNAIRLPLGIDSALLSLFFFSFGHCLRKNYWLQYQISCFKKTFLIVLLYITLTIIYKFNGTSNIRTLDTGNSIILCYLGALFGTMALILLSILINDICYSQIKGTIIFLGQNSLILLYTHRVFDGLIKSTIYLAGIEIQSRIIKYLMNMVLLIMFLIISPPIIKFIRSKMKYFMGK